VPISDKKKPTKQNKSNAQASKNNKKFLEAKNKSKQLKI
jgi:hypothetical protein